MLLVLAAGAGGTQRPMLWAILYAFRVPARVLRRSRGACLLLPVISSTNSS